MHSVRCQPDNTFSKNFTFTVAVVESGTFGGMQIFLIEMNLKYEYIQFIKYIYLATFRLDIVTFIIPISKITMRLLNHCFYHSNSFFIYIVTGVVPVQQRTISTALFALLPEEEMSPAQKEISTIQARWNVVRHMTKEEVDAMDDTTDGEWKAAHARYFERYHNDMEKMTEIVTKLKAMIDPPRIQKKSKSQRKRDKWNKIVARTNARAKEASDLLSVQQSNAAAKVE